MFIGHFAVAFAAKRMAPAVSLGTLFLAAQLADLIWPVLVLRGIEIVAIRPGITAMTPLDFIHYPYSHSLLALAAWSALLGGAWMLRHRPATTAALVIAAVVLSHWLLDVISHRPDMPLTLSGSTRLGLGLWNSVPATIVALLAIVYLASAFGPPSPAAVAWTVLAIWLLVAWAYWVDRHRSPIRSSGTAEVMT